jgi:large conductance mechanosensitive channel
MIKGFKEFLMRGNVIDLAVGIAIGVAFTTLVGAFGTFFVNPIVAVAGGDNPRGFGFEITNEATFVNIGGILNALIVFVVTMAVIYFAIVVPMQKLQEMRKRGEEPEPEDVPEDIALLREIRDSLQGGRRTDPGPGPAI